MILYFLVSFPVLGSLFSSLFFYVYISLVVLNFQLFSLHLLLVLFLPFPVLASCVVIFWCLVCHFLFLCLLYLCIESKHVSGRFDTNNTHLSQS